MGNVKRSILYCMSSLAIIMTIMATFSLVHTRGVHAAAASGVTREIPNAGTSSFAAASTGADGLQWPEFVGQSGNGPGPAPGSIVNRSQSQPHGNGASVNGSQKAKSSPELNVSFDGLNHRNQRLANGGNQFSLEPPDQGLCVGNGFVMEVINDVLRVYDTSGNPLIGVTDLNTFFGYPAAIHRAPPRSFGPFVTDPSCYFDKPTQHWFMDVLTLEVDPATGNFLGPNHIDLAVSQTANPTGLFTIYRIPVQDDGTQGTPNHKCDGSGGPGTFGPCLGDYPHIGADANGFYVTTNEYGLFAPASDVGFHAAQIYAFSKSALASGAASVAVTQFDTIGAVNGNPGFTVWPATTPGNQYAADLGGTEYFLSSDAAAEANGTGSSTDLIVWAFTNTQSLNTASPALSLSNSVLIVNPYAIPPKAEQKAGDFPLGQCINDTTTPTPFGLGCWRFFFTKEPAHDEVESHLDSNDTRMQQVVYANGKLWGALDTALTVNSVNKAGIEWFIVKPSVSSSGVSGSVANQGYLGLADTNLTYPAIGVTQSGRGVMAFTLVGTNDYPSAAYASIDAKVGVGDIHVAKAGVGPSDGFTSYVAFVGSPPRTRWGDYGAAVADGGSIWIASEYIGQTCTLAQYEAPPFGSCGGKRSSLGNWDTRISELSV